MPSKPKRPKRKDSPSATPVLTMSATESQEFWSALRQSKVSLGIDCAYFGFLLVSLVSVLDAAAPFALGNHSRDHFSAILLLTMLAFAAGILSAIGKLLCLTAPRPLSDMSSILFAALCDVGAVAASIARPFTALQPGLTTLLTVVTISLSVLGFVCFVWFLRQLGECLGDQGIQERASRVLNLANIMTVLVLSGIVLPLLPQILAAWGAVLLGFGLLVIGIIGVFRYLGLLSACRGALSKC